MRPVDAVLCPAGQDVLATLAVLIDEKVGEGGWDQPPALNWLVPAPLGMAVAMLPPLPDSLADLHPAHLLERMTPLLAGDAPKTFETIIGAAVTFEIWMAVAQLVADGRARQVRNRPDRVEARQTVVAVRGRDARLLCHFRNAGITVTDVGGDEGRAGLDAMQGMSEVAAVVRALHGLIGALP